MSKERFDIAIGILDNTENAIERIKNQHKFEKDLSEFLNTNVYSKDKYWVAGMLNQVSEYCKEKIDTLIENKKRIAELEEQLKNAIVPKFKIGQEVWYVEDKFTMESGEILEIQIWDLKKDNIVYVIEYGGNVWCESVIFATKEEAQAKLKELGENDVKD